jgi:NAD-dependent dihydropyrimidine dehydrogenase PreA subunit
MDFENHNKIKSRLVASIDQTQCCGMKSYCTPLGKCPTGAFVWSSVANSSEKGIISIDEEKCNGCGICAQTCACGIIKMIETPL